MSNIQTRALSSLAKFIDEPAGAQQIGRREAFIKSAVCSLDEVTGFGDASRAVPQASKARGAAKLK
jgi:hypothetical protein